MEHFKVVGKRLSNWGRWGADDQRGTLNFITAETVRRAASCIRTGQVFELSLPLDAKGPQVGGAGSRINPVHLMSVLPEDYSLGGVHICDDFITMPLQCATQWDSLAHVGYDGRFYNDVPAGAITAMGGASRNDIAAALPGIVGRGVLADVAGARGVDWVPGGEEIGPDELDRVLAAEGLELESGDILAVRTGWLAKGHADGWQGWMSSAPGLSLACAEWAHDHELASIVSDNWGIEVYPTVEPDSALPVHAVLIRDLGMMLGEMFELDELAAACRADGVYDFFFSGAPLRVTGGVGSPVSPIAVR